MNLQLDSLVKSIENLERSVITVNRIDDTDEDLQETVRAGVIQYFEVVYEQSWLMMQRWLKEKAGLTQTDIASKRDLFRRAAENALITDPEIWMDYHQARNSTSHTYDENAAEDVFNVATEFLHDAKQLLKDLEMRND